MPVSRHVHRVFPEEGLAITVHVAKGKSQNGLSDMDKSDKTSIAVRATINHSAGRDAAGVVALFRLALSAWAGLAGHGPGALGVARVRHMRHEKSVAQVPS